MPQANIPAGILCMAERLFQTAMWDIGEGKERIT